MSRWEAIFGSNLMIKASGRNETVPTSELLGSKRAVLVYFSAHWCPPCRMFTPELVKFYNDLKATRSDFEVVFVSSDRSESDFNEYYGEMPWAALPFSERDLKGSLSKKFKVSGIPTLAVLDADGSLITMNGREKVSKDPVGASFPWRPPSFEETLGSVFVGKNPDDSLSTVSGTTFIGRKYVALYFSAHWCGPCRGFTPKLVTYYKNRKEKQGKDDFEVVFISGDEDEEGFKSYFREMPWLAIPFTDEARRDALNEMFEVEGIPTLIIIGPDGKVVTKNARGGIESDPQGKKFPYAPEPIEELSVTVESYGSDINSIPSLLLFMEFADDSEQQDAKEALLPMATTMAKAKVDAGEEPDMLFFTVFGTSPLTDRVRDMVGLPKGREAAKEGAQVVILDIPDSGGYYKQALPDATEEALKSFVDAYKTGSLTRLQLE